MTSMIGGQSLTEMIKRATGLIFMLVSLASAAAYGQVSCIQATEPVLSIGADDDVFAFDVTQCQDEEQLTADLQDELLERWNGEFQRFDIQAAEFETALAVLKTDDSRGAGTPAYAADAIQAVQNFYQSGKADSKVLVGNFMFNSVGGTGIKALVVLYTAAHDKVVVLTKQTYSE